MFNFCDKHIDHNRCKNINLKENPTFAVRTPLHDPYHCERLTTENALITYVTEFEMETTVDNTTSIQEGVYVNY